MKSFRDPVTNILKAFGSADSNAPGDIARDEPEGFNLSPGKWQFVGGVWVPAVPPWAPIKAAELDGVRIAREQIIDRLGGMAGRRQRAGDAATASACDAAVLKLLDLTARPDVLAAANPAQLKSAVLAGYAEAKALLPLAVQNAFRGLDA